VTQEVGGDVDDAQETAYQKSGRANRRNQAHSHRSGMPQRFGLTIGARSFVRVAVQQDQHPTCESADDDGIVVG
jgi:hypothetical protein